MIIRPARPEDAAGIITAHAGSIRQICSADYTPEQIEASANRNFKNSTWVDIITRDFVWVIEHQKLILGYGHLALMSEAEAEIMGLYFLPEAKGLGFGKKMMEEFLRVARIHKIMTLNLYSTLTASGFYQKLGFKPSQASLTIEMRGVAIPCVPMSMEI